MQKEHPFYQFKYCPKCGSNEFVINNEKSKKCNACSFVYYFNSCSSTVALIVNEQKEVLVATRSKEPAMGTLDLPGGFVDLYETCEEAVIREVKEETNMDVSEITYQYSIPNTYMYSGFEVHTADMVYLCKVSNPKDMKAADDVAKLEYIKISELNADLFGLHSVKQIIKNIKNIKI